MISNEIKASTDGDAMLLVLVSLSFSSYLHPEGLVHGCEVEQWIGVHAALVQGGACAGEPDVLRRPP